MKVGFVDDNDSDQESCFLPSYRRPTQKSAHANRNNKMCLVGEIKGKLGMNKKREVFFGSLFESTNNSINAVSMSARIMDNEIKNRIGVKAPPGKSTFRAADLPHLDFRGDLAKMKSDNKT